MGLHHQVVFLFQRDGSFEKDEDKFAAEIYETISATNESCKVFRENPGRHFAFQNFWRVI